MKTNFNELKLNLVNYFVKVEKYKAVEKFSSDYVSYLVNKKNQYKIIRITIGSPVSSDKNLEQLKEELKEAKRQKIQILNIAITSDKIELEFEGKLVIVDSVELAMKRLVKIFPKINSLEKRFKNQLKEEDEDGIENISTEEVIEMLTNPSKSSNLKLKNAVARMNRHSNISIVLSLIFIIMPIVTVILSFMFFSNSSINGYVVDLFFGGTNRNLTINGQQWWRVFTYGFTTNSGGIIFALIQIFFISGMAIKLSRYTEGLVGSIKFAAAVFITYPLAGFFVSTSSVSETYIYSGSLGFLASIVGILGVTTWSKKREAIQLFSKNRLVIPIIMLVIYPLFTSSYFQYILIIASAAISTSITVLLTYDWKNSRDKLFILPIFILAACILAAFTFTFIPSFSSAHDIYSLNAISLYKQKGYISIEGANKLFNLNGWYWWYDTSGTLHSGL
ncbi:hypothetical protein [Spiroplasma taiwanense]|uniref:Putative rhomboid-like transmembrane protein n=1 Tax=Spiroplasma taiwanense CT-1 TaxID=1276220 RepID=S5MHS9_9MOLU|nr:hypothetical protein [Spiroplasma taiwanense]AGR41440.1 putative rhomboid-like transmembrane protein [Spiroplasma taiwanense CT-1]